MKTLIKIFILIAWIGLLSSYAQEIQWACRVTETNDRYSHDKWGVKSILGVPNTYPKSKIGSSWAMGLMDGGEEEELGDITIKVQFCKAIKAQQLVVVENFHPGAIKQIYIYDNKANERLIYEAVPQEQTVATRLLSIPFELMEGEITSVKLIAEPSKVAGANCIDAIALSSSKEPIVLKINEHHDKKFLPTIQFIGAEVNSEYDEYSPSITPDGNTLYFARLGHPENVGKEKGDLDIWYSTKQRNGKWAPAKNMGTPLNNKDHNFVASVAANGNALLLGNMYQDNGTAKSEGCAITHKVNGEWTMPKNVNMLDYFNSHEHLSFFLGNNEKIMLMAIEGKDQSFGEQDIYVSFEKQDGTWSSPMNLGSNINTVNSEANVFLAPDLQTLYFASNGYFGYGGFDIYMSKRLDDTWQNWSKPVNLGPIVNSEEDEFCFVITEDGRFAYGYKYFNERKKHDIYVIGLPPDADLLKNEPVVRIRGKVIDSGTKAALIARITVVDNKNKQEMAAVQTSESSGTFDIVLPKGTQYTVMANAQGYISSSEVVVTSGDTLFQEAHQDFGLIPIEVGQLVKIKSLLFKRGLPEMMESSSPELDNLVEFMKENPTVIIQLEGHTDNQGDPKGNIILSERRVRVVRQYMSNQGINSKRILIKAFGGTKPVASNAAEETRQLNRRVEFVIIKK